MRHGFLWLLSFFVLAVTDGFMLAFLADDPAVFPVIPNSPRRFLMPPTRLSRDDISAEPPPPPATWSKLNTSPVLSRITRNEVNTRRVENMLVDFFAALIHADDCTLLERQTQLMGVVYLDTNFSMSRPPRLLRTGVREIMGKYNLEMRPVERKWTCTYNDNATDADLRM